MTELPPKIDAKWSTETNAWSCGGCGNGLLIEGLVPEFKACPDCGQHNFFPKP